MDDLSPLLEALREVSIEIQTLTEEEESFKKRRELVLNRRVLLNTTWSTLIKNPGMTLVQAKMIAHEEETNKKRRNQFLWASGGDSVPETWWILFLRKTYLLLGGR